MITVEFEPEGWKELGQRLDEADMKARMSINEGLRAIKDFMVPILKQHTPVGRRPRRKGSVGQSLRGGTRAEVIEEGDTQRLEIRQGARTPKGAFYGRFVREGTRAHTIKPVTAPYLHFRLPNGQWVRTKLVNHPGTRANPYHERALAEAAPQIQYIVTAMGQRITAWLGGR